MNKNLVRRSRRKRLPAILAVLMIAVVGLAVAGCGSSSSSSSSSTSSTASNTSSTAAAAAATKAATRPANILVTQPVGKPIPTGKTVAYIHCGLPACNIWASALKQAAAVLGWKATIYYTNGTPESVQAAWKQAVIQKPDAVIASGFDKVIFAQQLAQLKADNIPVVEAFVTDPPGDGIDLVVGTGAEYAQVGEAEAAEAVVAGGAKPDAVYVNLPAYQIVQPSRMAFHATFAKYCPSCTQASFNIPITELGNGSTNVIVSYLRSHPDVNVVVNSNSGLSLGLPAALKSAGLSNVKIIDDAPTATNYDYIRAGDQLATENVPIQATMWQLVDALARHFAGTSMAPDNKPPQFWLLTKSNIPSSDDFSNILNYQQQYKSLWGK
jgi:ABC-type sugar transport system substrate-binding protein